MSRKARKHTAAGPGPDGQISRPISRRTAIVTAIGAVAVVVAGTRFRRRPAIAEGAAKVTVFKDPACTCCGKWVERMRENGFDVETRDVADVPRVKRERKVPERLYSCHTALAGEYVFEGHVPPDLVLQVLRDRPRIVGLAVPGMPASAPGMESGRGSYEVISFTAEGTTAVFAVRS